MRQTTGTTHDAAHFGHGRCGNSDSVRAGRCCQCRGLHLELLTACGHKKAPPSPAPPQVKVVTLKSQPVSLTTELPGRTVAFKVAEIRPQVSGVILKRMFTEGADVRMGQQLYQIDPALYRAAYASAAATAESARAQAERFKPLAEVNAVSKQDYDNAVAQAAQTRPRPIPRASTSCTRACCPRSPGASAAPRSPRARW